MITTERAIKLLTGEIPDIPYTTEEVEEACRLACEALRHYDRADGSVMTAERAIKLLSSGVRMPDVPHTADEVDEACLLACEAIRRHKANKAG